METIGGLIEYYKINGAYVYEQFIRHFLISIYGVIFASLIVNDFNVLNSKLLVLTCY